MPHRSPHLRKIVLASIATLLFSLASIAQTHPFISFDAPDAVNGTFPAKINSAGQIAGQYQDGDFHNHGFVRNPDGKLTEFDVPSFRDTQAVSINSAGQIVGHYTNLGSSEGFLRTPDGTFHRILVPGATTTSPTAINDNGSIAGYYQDHNFAYHGFVRDSSGAYTTIDVGGGNVKGTKPLSINNSGEIAGAYTDSSQVNHGFIRNASGVITTFDVPGGTQTFSANLNNNGDVTGFYDDSSHFSASYVRHADGTFLTFKFGEIPTIALSINDAGYVCGFSQNPSDIGFLRTPSGTDLLYSGPQPNLRGECNDVNGKLRATGTYMDGSGIWHGWVR